MTDLYSPLIHIPWDVLPNSATAIAFTSQALSTNNTRIAFAGWQAKSTDAITHGGFRLTTITDGGTMPTYIMELYALDASGLPTGAAKASKTFVPTVANGFANNTFTWLQYTSAYTPTAGESLAETLSVSSGTADASNNISVGYTLANVVGNRIHRPYVLVDTDAVWAAGDKQGTAIPVFGWKTATHTFGLPFEAVGSLTASATTEQALRWTLNGGFGNTYKCEGAQVILPGVPAGSRLFRLSLYSGGESTPSLLAQAEFDSDHSAATTAGRISNLVWDDGPISLNFSTQYHLSLALDSGTSLTIQHYQSNTAADFNEFPFGGTFCAASRTITYPPGGGGNAFASSATELKQRPTIFPLLTDWTEPAGGSGLARIIGG